MIILPVQPSLATYRIISDYESEGSTNWVDWEYDDANNNSNWESETENRWVADIDGDGLTWSEEQAVGSDPYLYDSDYDGLSDGDEVNVSVTSPLSWDTDNDGYSDFDAHYNCWAVNYLQLGFGYSASDWDGDGIANPWDAYPTDITNGYGDSYSVLDPGFTPEGTTPSDYDGDGYTDDLDSDPENVSLWTDFNRNGYNDDLEGGLDWDGDLHLNDYDSDPWNMNLWTDWNRNGVNDDEEQFTPDPYDPSTIIAPGEYDGDGDGVLNTYDSDDGNAAVWSDWDNDLFNAEDDSHPNDAALWSDWDFDGLNADDEIAANTDPYDADSDNDGLSDGDELEAHTDPNDVDTDDDGLTDFEELVTYAMEDDPNTPGVEAGPDPLDPVSLSTRAGRQELIPDYYMISDADTDDDGIPDAIEDFHYPFLNKDNARDAQGDLDGDGVSNLDEYLNGTHVRSDISAYDSDGDGLSNALENALTARSDLLGMFSELNPDDAAADFDDDGLINAEEIHMGFNLIDYATDDPNVQSAPGAWYQVTIDGVPHWEWRIVGETTSSIPVDSPDLIQGAEENRLSLSMPFQKGDTDNDGLPDTWEYRYRGTDGSPGMNFRDARDCGLDIDGDGLSNEMEYRLGSNPLVYGRPDTDHDGVDDQRELAYGTDPLDIESAPPFEVEVLGDSLRYQTVVRVDSSTDPLTLPGALAVRVKRAGIYVSTGRNNVPLRVHYLPLTGYPTAFLPLAQIVVGSLSWQRTYASPMFGSIAHCLARVPNTVGRYTVLVGVSESATPPATWDPAKCSTNRFQGEVVASAGANARQLLPYTGLNQEAVEGQPVQNKIGVRLANMSGTSLSGQTVNFSAPYPIFMTTSGAKVVYVSNLSVTTGLTNTSTVGRAAVSCTAPMGVLGPVQFTASSIGAAPVILSFNVAGTPPTLQRRLDILSGNGQQAVVGASFNQPLVVRASAAWSNGALAGVSGAYVRFDCGDSGAKILYGGQWRIRADIPADTQGVARATLGAPMVPASGAVTASLLPLPSSYGATEPSPVSFGFESVPVPGTGTGPGNVGNGPGKDEVIELTETSMWYAGNNLGPAEVTTAIEGWVAQFDGQQEAGDLTTFTDLMDQLYQGELVDTIRNVDLDVDPRNQNGPPWDWHATWESRITVPGFSYELNANPWDRVTTTLSVNLLSSDDFQELPENYIHDYVPIPAPAVIASDFGTVYDLYPVRGLKKYDYWTTPISSEYGWTNTARNILLPHGTAKTIALVREPRPKGGSPTAKIVLPELTFSFVKLTEQFEVLVRNLPGPDEASIVEQPHASNPLTFEVVTFTIAKDAKFSNTVSIVPQDVAGGANVTLQPNGDITYSIIVQRLYPIRFAGPPSQSYAPYDDGDDAGPLGAGTDSPALPVAEPAEGFDPGNGDAKFSFYDQFKKMKVAKLMKPVSERGNIINGNIDLRDPSNDQFFVGIKGLPKLEFPLSFKLKVTGGQTSLWPGRGKRWVDDETTIPLHLEENVPTAEVGADGTPKVVSAYLSPRMVLVPTALDDSHSYSCSNAEKAGKIWLGVASDDADVQDPEDRADVTHLASVGSAVEVTAMVYGSQSFSLQKPLSSIVERNKVIRLKVRAFQDSDVVQQQGGAWVVKDEVYKDLERAQELLAQIGATIELLDVPEVVGYPGGQGDSKNIPAHDTGIYYAPSARAALFLDECGVPNGADYYTVVYVNKILSDTDDTVGYAYIRGPESQPASKYAGSLLLGQGPINTTRNALAHEICHLLTNMGHFGVNYAKAATTGTEKYKNNLMQPLSESLTGPGSKTRIDERQAAMIYQQKDYP